MASWVVRICCLNNSMADARVSIAVFSMVVMPTFVFIVDAGSSGGPKAVAFNSVVSPSGEQSAAVGRLAWRDAGSGWLKSRKAASGALDAARRTSSHNAAFV